MAVSRASSDWLLHPSLVFKTFEESLIKSPFSYGNSPHIVPEKIVESFVDQNGIRCYRVKWLDSWLTEQHVTASFPHLITEYWINKPINDTNVDYQNYIVQGQGRNLANIPLPVTSSNNVSAKPVPVPRASSKAQNVSEALQQQISQQQPSTSITISQLFNNEVNKDVEIPCAANNVEQSDDSTGEPDFNVSENNLELTGKAVVDKQDSSNKVDKKFNNDEQQNTLSEIPKISESSMVFLFDKNSNYAEHNQSDREKSLVSKMQAIPPFNPPPFKNHISSFSAPHGMRLPSMEQINQQSQHMPSLVTVEVATIEKKPTVKRSPTKQPKPATNKDKQPVVCDLCGKTISSRKNLRVHKTVKHFKNGSFGCQICGRKFALNRDLKRHMPLHTNERKYECPHCGLQCKQPGHLTKHIRTHTEVMNWRCDCCFKNFKVQAELKKHCFTEHADINKENLTCSVCKEKLKLPNSVYLHSLRHSGVREFQCHICKASFKLKQHMQVHMKTHEKPKDIEKIICPICTREFRFKHTYEKHFSKHIEKTKEEYEENKRLRLEEKKRKQEKKLPGEMKIRKKKIIKEDESMLSASDGEEAKNPHKRKLRRPEKVLYDKEFKTKLLVREKDQYNLICEFCDVTFTSEELLESHVREEHKSGKFIKSIPRSVSFIQDNQIVAPDLSMPMESQMVMLKLPEPIIVNNEPNKSTSNTASESMNHAAVINVLSAMQNKDVVTINNRLTQLENRDDSEGNCGELRIDIGAEDTVESSLPEEVENQGNNIPTTVNS